MFGYSQAVTPIFALGATGDPNFLYENLAPLNGRILEEIKRLATDAALLFGGEPEDEEEAERIAYAPVHAWAMISSAKPKGGIDCLTSLLLLPEEHELVSEYLPFHLSEFKFSEIEKAFHKILDKFDYQITDAGWKIIVTTLKYACGKNEKNWDQAAGFFRNRLRLADKNSPLQTAHVAKSIVSFGLAAEFPVIYSLFLEDRIVPEIFGFNEFLYELKNILIERELPDDHELAKLARIAEKVQDDEIGELEKELRKQMDTDFPVRKEFRAIRGFDEDSVLQRGILLAFHSQLNEQEFLFFVEQMNIVADNARLQRISHEVYRSLNDGNDDLDETDFEMILQDALDADSRDSMRAAPPLEPRGEAAIRWAAETLHSIIGAKLEAARRDWNLLANLAHWSLANLLEKGGLPAEFEIHRAVLQTVYGARRGSDRKGADETSIFYAMQEILISEMLFIIYEMLGERSSHLTNNEPGSHGYGKEIFKYRPPRDQGDPRLN